MVIKYPCTPNMLLEPQTTEWDLRWQMFGIPVRVHPMFWLATLLMGQASLQIGAAYLVAWVACVFVSILIHELGHVLMGRVYGTNGQIVLYAFGGLAIGSNHLRNRWQRVAVSLAGPGAGFIFLIAILGLLWLRNADDGTAYFALAGEHLGIDHAEETEEHIRAMVRARRLEVAVVDNLIFINLFWGLVNLLPIWPLDGGQVCREVCNAASPGRGIVISLQISIVVSGFVAACALLDKMDRPILPFPFGGWFTVLFFGAFAWQSYEELKRAQSQSRWLDDHWDH